ncbi:2OG-Fe(II) oxygenase [Sphingomonas sp. MMS24-J45]|uniref:2OG-Fe(II) oxygenase n=1 Tax=Sphingomonas sp. MMS24-J45 TaxID=3238806 RepID=UPI00384B345C
MIPTVAHVAALEIGANAVRFEEEAEASVAAALAERPAILLTGLLAPDFRRMLDAPLRLPFVEQRVAGAPGMRQVEPGIQPASGALVLALRRAPLLRWLERVAGCGTLVHVEGEVAEHRAGGQDFLSWHQDTHKPGRRLALVIDLSDDRYEGGMFELRDRQTKQMLIRHHHNQSGSALLFRISDALEHRVLPVTSGGPRRVFACGFHEAK